MGVSRRSFIKVMGDGKMAGNAVQRIKQLDAERTKLLDGAKRDALDRATQAVADLVALGFTYSLANGKAARGRPKASAKRNGMGKKGAECPICEFMTSPAHDARKHRFSQGKRKRPFTAKELSEQGLQKVG